MVAFYHGSRDEIKDELAKQDRPKEFMDYVAMPVRIDNRLPERRMQKRTGPVRPYRANMGKRVPPRRGNTSWGTHRGPMELDATQHPSTKRGIKCFNCGKPGHHARECTKPRQPQKKTLATINRAPGNGKPQGQTGHTSPEQGPGTLDMEPILRTIALVGRDEYPTEKEEGEHEQALKYLAGASTDLLDTEPSGEACGSKKSIARMVAATRLLTTDHLHATVEINGKFAKAFLDSGAQGGYGFLEFARHYGLELRTKRNPYIVLIERDAMIFNNGTVNQETARLPIYMDGKETPTIFDVLDTGSRDFVLGIPRLRRWSPRIDWETTMESSN